MVVEAGEIQVANEQAVDTMGIPRERLIGVPFAELLLPEFEDGFNDLLSGAEQASIEGSQTAAVRLAAALAPIEISARGLGESRVMLAVRSMATEHHYSSLAGGALTHDVVTGLPDHFHVLSQLHQRLTAPKRLPMAIMCVWVDELEELGNVHGQRAIERVIKEVASRIQKKLRAPDLLGRFEKAGFLVLMTTDSPAAQLTDVAERLRDEVAFPIELDGKLVSFTTSVVIGSVNRNRPSIERVLAVLEAAANRATISGGNRTDVLAI